LDGKERVQFLICYFFSKFWACQNRHRLVMVAVFFERNRVVQAHYSWGRGKSLNCWMVQQNSPSMV